MSELNTSVLRILENCEEETMLHVLLQLLCTHKANARMQHTINNCLMKILSGLYKKLKSIVMDGVFLKMHVFLTSINHKNLNQHNEKSIGIMKTIVHKIVLERKESVIDAYQVIRTTEAKDKHLHKWIRTGLKSL